MLSIFDPENDLTILEPEDGTAGCWAGAPSVLHEPDNGRFLLVYRRRRPRGRTPDRGYQVAIAESADGIHLTDIWSVTKDQLDTTSMERFCLRRDADGYVLYLSYVDPADNRWRIDAVRSADIRSLDVATRTPVLTADSTGTEGVKDPYVVKLGPAHYLIASFARSRLMSAEELEEAHGTADIYNTGITTCPTGLAVSYDGTNFQWLGEILPTGSGWDRYQARINSVLQTPSVFVGFYDGSAGADENYEERCGLAVSFDLKNWDRLTTSEPWVSAPHGTGSLRYLDAIQHGSELWFYYEYARPDGSHELRLHRQATA